MASTDKILGQISAIDTFIENFPMSILDMMNGKVYTSAFDFLVDVLIACGVNVNEIMSELLSKIYGLEAKVDEGIESIYERIMNGSLEYDAENNKLMEGLEEGVKVIFMALLSSLYTCSVIPVLPNKIFDAPKDANFLEYDKEGNVKEKDSVITLLQANAFKPFLVPKKAIDPMGLLDICPTSRDGRLYYDIEGKDVYYKKEIQYVQSSITKTYVADMFNAEVNTTICVEENVYINQIPIYIEKITDGIYKNLYVYNICVGGENPMDENFKIVISYKLSDSNSINKQTIITKKDTPGMFILSPTNEKTDSDGNKIKNILTSLTINGQNESFALNENTFVYLDKEKSEDFYNEWSGNGADSFPWGSENTEQILREKTTTATTNEYGQYEVQELISVPKYVYNAIDSDKLNKIIYDNARRVNAVPEYGDKDSYEYIVCYDGLNPNILYKTNDMNAFIWYALHKGMKNPQVEYNHMMWDNRIKASKRGIKRNSPVEWNEWYNSKAKNDDEFLFNGNYIDKTTPLYPIMQLGPQGVANNLLVLKIPSQRYFRPRTRNSNIDGSKDTKNISFNASIYKYNWEYLNSIRIFKPKILLVSLLEKILGICASTIKSIDVNISKKIIQSKISKAIENVMEANDMEVEDCFMAFSNDDVNAMLEEMLLSRYDATIIGGNTAVAKQHDVQKYIGMIEQSNKDAVMQGTTTTITKMVSEINVTPGSEGSVDFGVGDVDLMGGVISFLKKVLKAILSSIVESIFTPQLILIIYMNFELLGISKDSESFLNADLGKILNFILNKMFRLLKSIIKFVLNKVLELLLELLLKKVLPKILKYKCLLILEQIEYWMKVLISAINCLPLFKFNLPKYISQIDDVQYADIENTQNTPESTSLC